MKVIHNLGILNASRDTNENAGFLLTNCRGGYCSFFSEPSSRYYGFFYFNNKNMKMYKFIENIEIVGGGNTDFLKNNFYFAERKKDDIIESFFVPKGFDSLAYELNSEHEIDIILDCKESYDNREWGRNYEISEENGIITVKFTKKTDKREDKSGDEKEFELYLSIKSDNNYFQKNDKWIERDYFTDGQRIAPPYKRHVYNALRLKGKTFVFTISDNKNSAVKECEHVFNSLNEIKNKDKENFYNLLKKEDMKKILSNKNIDGKIKIAYVNAANSLNNLIVKNKNNNALFAGLPWFFQFWSRDTLISLKAMSKIDKKISEKILLDYLGKIGNDGRLPNLTGHHDSKMLGSADAAGWLFARCSDFARKIENNKSIINSIKSSIKLIKQNKGAKSPSIKEYIKKCSVLIAKKEKENEQLLYEIECSLEKSVNGLLKNHTKEHFETNASKETWMDTDFGDDGREGFRIEIQALRLNMFRLMYDLTLNHKYKILENTLRIKMKHKFWNGKILADGLNDFTIRPNIFIASYAYHELLSSKEWETCFENSLKSLWLDWGGLSTIDKNNKLFTDTNTGEDSKSYHRGDSWLWLNNLAAIELNKINPKKFQNQIQKIISASTEDVLWKGCIGCASELSSAKELISAGCFSQAWSNAMYVELIDEIFC